jgi:hypothetical protein
MSFAPRVTKSDCPICGTVFFIVIPDGPIGPRGYHTANRLGCPERAVLLDREHFNYYNYFRYSQGVKTISQIQFQRCINGVNSNNIH